MRETAQLVARAAELQHQSSAGAGALEATSTWLREHDIIGGLLRANLHLAQYVAQVTTFPLCRCCIPSQLGPVLRGHKRKGLNFRFLNSPSNSQLFAGVLLRVDANVSKYISDDVTVEVDIKDIH